MPKFSKIDNQGQVLLLVVVSLAVLLGVGLSISSQTISSITRTSRSDSLQKVTAAAEGGLESYLIKTDSELKQKVESISTTTETIYYPNSNTKAEITISPVKTSDGITFDTVEPGEVATFYFTNSPGTSYSNGTTCLQITSSGPDATLTDLPDYMMNVVYKNPNTLTTFKTLNTVNSATGVPDYYDATKSNNYLMDKYLYSGGAFSADTKYTYDTLGNILTTTTTYIKPTPCGSDNYSFNFKNAVALRIHPLSSTINNLKIKLINTTDSYLPSVVQGFKITSVGKFDKSTDTTIRTIDAVKYLDAPSNIFDYAGFLDN